MGKPIRDLAGFVSGKLTVSCFDEIRSGHAYWLCDCECGGVTSVRGSHLTKAKDPVTSCGCNVRTIDGDSLNTNWEHWRKIISRCYDKNDCNYKNYGARGIAVCEFIRESFSNTVSLIGLRPSENHVIDRTDNDLGYNCGKCEECIKNKHKINIKWSTYKESARNRRSNRSVTINGITKLLCEWAEEHGIQGQLIALRIKKGYDDDDLLKPAGYFNVGRRP